MLEEESSHPVGLIFYCDFSFMILIKYHILIINNTNGTTPPLLRAEIIWVPKGVERSDASHKCLIPLYCEASLWYVVAYKPTAKVERIKETSQELGEMQWESSM